MFNLLIFIQVKAKNYSLKLKHGKITNIETKIVANRFFHIPVQIILLLRILYKKLFKKMITFFDIPTKF